MSFRRKAYQRTGNEQRVKEIRESLRKRASTDRSSIDKGTVKQERFREKDDVENHMKEADNILNGTYDQKCSYLNDLNTIITETKLENLSDNLFFDDLCSLTLKFLKDDHPHIRAMCFHILKNCTLNERNLTTMLTTHVDIYVVRAVDLKVENDYERIEAFKLIVWMMKIYEKSNLKKLIVSSAEQKDGKDFFFPKSVMQPIISIALDAFQEDKPGSSIENQEREYGTKDRLTMPCVGLFLEFCLSEPDLILEMVGTDWMVRVLTGISTMSRRVVVLVSHVLDCWLDNPHIRIKADLHLVLEQIFAPLVEYGLFQKRANMLPNSQITESSQMSDVLEIFKHVFISLLRSWSGLFSCSSIGPNSSISTSSPLRLLEYLGLGTVANDNLLRIRETIVDLCIEFVDLPYANKKFETWEDALLFYKTMHLPDKFKSSLKNDFVIAQNDMKMKNDVNRKKPTVDLLAAFRILSQFILINASLPQSLSRLILAQPDSPSGLKATLLMADMLRFVPSHVPLGWRAPVLSLPTLVQSACEALIQSKASAACNGTLHDEDLIDFEQYTFIHARNAEVVLHRFDELNQSWIRSATNSEFDFKESDLRIFVPHMSTVLPLSTLPGNVKKSKSEVSLRQFGSIHRPLSTETIEDENLFENLVIKGKYDKMKLMKINQKDDYDYNLKNGNNDFFENDEEDTSFLRNPDGSIDWNYAEYYLELLECETIDKIIKQFSAYSMKEYVSNIFAFISPKACQKYRRFIGRQHVIVIKSLINLLLRIMPFSDSLRTDFNATIIKYVSSFRKALEERNEPNSSFGSRNLSYTGSMFHFAIIGTLTTTQIGYGILNDVGILHLYVELMETSTSPEHIKLIISSLDYSAQGLSRVILGKALTATNELSRKWCTRFLSILASVEVQGFSEWGIQYIIRQLSDESPKVVRHAIRLLNRWLPEYPSKMVQRIQWSSFGEAGEMLRPHQYADEMECMDNKTEVCELIRLWMKVFNEKHFEIIDEEMKEMVFSVKRSLDGEFSRNSSERPDTSLGVPAPLHLFGALASHATGRKLLEQEHVCEVLLNHLDVYGFTCPYPLYKETKGCLLALGSIGSTNGGFEILPIETVPKIIKVAEEHSVLSIRGAAFWALTIMAQSTEGSMRLAKFGWESNRYRYTIEIAKKKAQDIANSKEEESGINQSWKTISIGKNALHRNSMIVEPQITVGKTCRAKSESALIRRGRSKSRPRSSSDGQISIQPPKQLTPSETAHYQRTWKSEIVLYGSNTPSEDAMSTSPNKKSIGNWCILHHQIEVPTMTTAMFSGIMNSDNIAAASYGTSKLSVERRRANTACSLLDDDDCTKTRSSTIARCLRDGLVIPREQLEAEGSLADSIMEAHFSCRLREKYHLSPFRVRSTLRIERNIGDPVVYVFMTKDEERHFAEFREKLVGDRYLAKELRQEQEGKRRTVDVVPLQTIALPAEIDVMCGNIFPPPTKNDLPFGLVDTEDNEAEARARLGNFRNDVIIQPHSAFRCFYCSGQGEINFTFTHTHPDAASLRKEVLNQVDMLEIKEYPAKRLIGLRQHHEWLFKWPCLYADVLELLDKYRFKPHSRSFLQQIFYDALQL